jgi:hypothetical protein
MIVVVVMIGGKLDHAGRPVKDQLARLVCVPVVEVEHVIERPGNFALQAYIERRLIKPELAALRDPRGLRKAFAGPLSYLLGAAAAWIDTPAAFVIYALTPLFYVTPPAARGRARHEEPAVER